MVNGKSNGYGSVLLENKIEAARAISELDKKFIKGRFVELKMTRFLGSQ